LWSTFRQRGIRGKGLELVKNHSGKSGPGFLPNGVKRRDLPCGARFGNVELGEKSRTSRRLERGFQSSKVKSTRGKEISLAYNS